MSVPFVHRTSFVSVLALMDTLLYLFHRSHSEFVRARPESWINWIGSRPVFVYISSEVGLDWISSGGGLDWISSRGGLDWTSFGASPELIVEPVRSGIVLSSSEEVLLSSSRVVFIELVRPSQPKGFRPLFSTTSRDLRPRLPDLNFRMINLPAEDTAISIYSKIFNSSSVRIPFTSFLLAVLKYFKVHISQLVPIDKVPTSFNQNHVDQLKAYIVKLCDIPEGVMVWSRLSRVWRNQMCDPVLRRPDNTGRGIYDFLFMPSLDKVTVREEPHGLDTSILGRVADRTTSPAPAGTAIPRAFLKEIVVTQPDPRVVTKADHAAKRKSSNRPEISTNAAKKTKSSKKRSGAGSSGQSAGDRVEQAVDGTLNDDDQHDDTEFSMEGIERFNDVSQGKHINVIPLRTFNPSIGLDVIYPPILLPDKEVKPDAELFGGVRRAARADFRTSYGKLVFLLNSVLGYTKSL
ncbi:hypothetical protein Tco_0947966 [Tanacetum coccineum]